MRRAGRERNVVPVHVVTVDHARSKVRVDDGVRVVGGGGRGEVFGDDPLAGN